MKKWPVTFSLDCQGQVWNIVSAYGTSKLLLEIRRDTTQVAYQVIDCRTWEAQEVRPDMNHWWSHVVFFDGNRLLVSLFDDNSNPDVTSLVMLSAADGAVQWRKENARLADVRADGLMISEPGAEVLTDPATGLEATDVRIGKKLAVELPWHYSEGEEYFIDVAAFISAALKLSPERAIDYLESGENFVSAFYTRHENLLRLHLVGADHTGEVRLNEILENELKGIADPSFFILDRNVIFVKEKRHFFVYRLSTE